MITAVCISKERQSLQLNIPFVSYTENYQSITHRDNRDMSRIRYLTDRYNAAVRSALEIYSETEDILLIDHYYLRFIDQIRTLVDDYRQLSKAVLGASIWYWARKRIRPWIAYYDTLSVPEFQGKRWWNARSLPRGIISVSGVGGCWIFPRVTWERTDGFVIPSPLQAGGSRGLDTSHHRVLLDCNSRFWRTHDTNPDIPDYSMRERIATTFGHARRKLFRTLRSPLACAM